MEKSFKVIFSDGRTKIVTGPTKQMVWDRYIRTQTAKCYVVEVVEVKD